MATYLVVGRDCHVAVVVVVVAAAVDDADVAGLRAGDGDRSMIRHDHQTPLARATLSSAQPFEW